METLRTRRSSRLIGILILTCGSIAAHIGPASAQKPAPFTYSIADLGTLGGDSSEAFGLNTLGDVVGASTTTGGVSHAFLFRNSSIIDLGTLPGGASSAATSINDRGDIAGYSGINAFGPQFRDVTQGFVLQAGAMRAVGALYCPCTFNTRYGTSAALGLSHDGWVVGESQTNRQTFTGAFVWQDGAIRSLGFESAHPGDSRAYAINDIHEIVGETAGRAFLVRDGVVEDLGVLPGYATSSARAVNNKGEAAGVTVNAAGTARAFLWDSNQMRGLNPLDGDVSGEARAINAYSDVVGRSGDAGLTTTRAVLWHEGAAIDLTSAIDASDWTLSSANAINDVGQIAGVGEHGGRVRAYLLTPR